MHYHVVTTSTGVSMRFLFFIFCALSSAAHAQVYKCTVPGGGVSMQQTPCTAGAQGGQVEVRPGSGHSPIQRAEPSGQKSAGAMLGPLPGSTYVEQLNRMTNARLLRELTQEREEILQDRGNLGREMDSKLASLKNTKGLARNNIAGATWEQSLSTEMLAVVEAHKVKAGAIDTRLADVDAKLLALSKK